MEGLNIKLYRDIIYAIINNDQEYLKGITRSEARKILKERFIKDLEKATGYKYNNDDVELLYINASSSFPQLSNLLILIVTVKLLKKILNFAQSTTFLIGLNLNIK